MHSFAWFGSATSHYKHHYDESFGFVKDFKSYGKVLVIFLPLLLISLSIGIAVILGGIVFVAFAAYTHKLQHQNPTKCFWMKVPVHYLHHKYDCRCNFGLSLELWDIIFGTYRPQKWLIDNLNVDNLNAGNLNDLQVSIRS